MLVCVCVMCVCVCVCVVNATYGSMGGAGLKYNIYSIIKLNYATPHGAIGLCYNGVIN